MEKPLTVLNRLTERGIDTSHRQMCKIGKACNATFERLHGHLPELVAQTETKHGGVQKTMNVCHYPREYQDQMDRIIDFYMSNQM